MIYTFLDTGILDELLRVPEYSDDSKAKQIEEEFLERTENGEKLIIPFAVMIELGNHIAQIKNEKERERCAAHFTEFLDKSRNNMAPWMLCLDGLTEEQVAFISEKFMEIGAGMAIGTGDISIVHQYKAFSETVSGTAECVRIWSLDHHISSLIRKLEKNALLEKKINRRRFK